MSFTGVEKTRKVPDGSVLFVCIGSTIGKIGIASKELATNQQINSIIPNLRNSGVYLFYALSQQSKRIASYAGCQAVPIINKSSFESTRIPLPPLPEQKKIAEILSTWDEAIDQSRKLIDAKCKLKKALMQQLLTGGVRFTEFGTSSKKMGGLPKGWREIRLEDVTTIFFSGVDKKAYDGQRRVRLCNYMDVYSNDYITTDIDFMWATASDTEIEKFALKLGDVIITKDSEAPDDIGIPTVVIDNLDDVICGYHLALIRPDSTQADSIFLAKEIAHERVSNQLSRLANGVTRFGLTSSSVKKVKIWLPQIAEQKHISSILIACDHSIELLRIKKIALEKQKRGLMQKLLTGEIRMKC